ncbi:uncharacterized protein V6R79_018737, partial [Siganus canaliculatus]
MSSTKRGDAKLPAKVGKIKFTLARLYTVYAWHRLKTFSRCLSQNCNFHNMALFKC